MTASEEDGSRKPIDMTERLSWAYAGDQPEADVCIVVPFKPISNGIEGPQISTSIIPVYRQILIHRGNEEPHLTLIIRSKSPAQSSRKCTLPYTPFPTENKDFPLHTTHPILYQGDIWVRPLWPLCADRLIGTSIASICFSSLSRFYSLLVRTSTRRDYELTGQCSGAFSGTVDGRMADDETSSGEGGGIACCVAIIVVR